MRPQAKNLVTLLFSLWACITHGQYLNFDKTYDLNQHHEFCANIEVVDSSYYVYSVRSESNGQTLFQRCLNSQGNELWTSANDLGSNNLLFSLFSDSYQNLSNGSTSGIIIEQEGIAGKSLVFSFDETVSNFEWAQEILDDIAPIELTAIREDSSGNVVVAGRQYLSNDEDPFDLYTSLIMIRLDLGGEILESWSIDIGSDRSFTPTDIQFTQDGAYLIFGRLSTNSNNAVFTLESSGEIIQELSWGHPELAESRCYALAKPDGEFWVTYKQAFEPGLSSSKGKVYLSSFNPSTNDFSSSYEFPYLMEGCHIGDIEYTLDGGMCIIGWSTDYLDSISYSYGWMLRLDVEGNEEWFRTYQHGISGDPNEFARSELYDLEESWDGGFVCAGIHVDEDNPKGDLQQTWILKVDACGDVIWDDCEPIMSSHDLTDRTVSVFPIPALDELTIQLPAASRSMIHNVSLIDSRGRRVLEKQFGHTGVFSIDVSLLEEGTYILHVEDEEKHSWQSKVLICR